MYQTFFISANSLKVGDYILLEKRPCKIIHIAISKPGKHGSSKANIEGIDLFTGKKRTGIFKTHQNVEVPVVTKEEYQLSNIEEDGFLSLFNPKNSLLKEDISLPKDEELANQIKNSFYNDKNNEKDILVTILISMGEEQVISVKVH